MKEQLMLYFRDSEIRTQWKRLKEKQDSILSAENLSEYERKRLHYLVTKRPYARMNDIEKQELSKLYIKNSWGIDDQGGSSNGLS